MAPVRPGHEISVQWRGRRPQPRVGAHTCGEGGGGGDELLGALAILLLREGYRGENKAGGAFAMGTAVVRRAMSARAVASTNPPAFAATRPAARAPRSGAAPTE